MAGIEMEIVNSCEANNGGCSHGCSHTSAGPLCTCPRGYELDSDQRTCIGVCWLLTDARTSTPGIRCHPESGIGKTLGPTSGSHTWVPRQAHAYSHGIPFAPSVPPQHYPSPGEVPVSWESHPRP
ncbi:hypothetical protein P7K49_015237 [Saguinus oedipus]|uniref:Uncharacterized protein n=1 Tax=Saguinus oedipus TaxID=9490 RepID=A0ABQ9V8P8_SAGOE|nr:hypothetical protein P7K49_015237 [Saguinus oedipus]